MIKLTEMETAVLKGIDNSEFGCGIKDPIWTFSVEGSVPKQSLGGVIGSLSKKGLILQMDIYGDEDSTIEMTDLGVQVYKEQVNLTPNKS